MQTSSSTTHSWQLLQALLWTDFVVPETKAAVITAAAETAELAIGIDTL